MLGPLPSSATAPSYCNKTVKQAVVPVKPHARRSRIKAIILVIRARKKTSVQRPAGDAEPARYLIRRGSCSEDEIIGEVVPREAESGGSADMGCDEHNEQREGGGHVFCGYVYPLPC
jgi:hypothetical protein